MSYVHQELHTLGYAPGTVRNHVQVAANSVRELALVCGWDEPQTLLFKSVLNKTLKALERS